MVKRKRLAKNIFVFALALCMVFTSVTPTMTVNAEGEMTLESADKTYEDESEAEAEQDEENSDGEKEDASTVEDSAEEDGADNDSANPASEGSENSNKTEPDESSDDSDMADEVSDSSSIDSTNGTALEDGEAASVDEGADSSKNETDDADTVDADVSVSDSSGNVIAGLMGALTAVLTVTADGETGETDYNLSNYGPVVIAKGGTYNITGTYPASSNSGSEIETVEGEDTEVGYPAITVKSGVTANITLSNVNITVEGVAGKHLAAIYIEDGATVTLTLDGENTITGKNLPKITKNDSTNVIGIWIGGTPSDNSTSEGDTSLTIKGNGSLSISEVGTGISNTALNNLTISGATVTMKNIYMLDSTVSGMGIYNNGTLKVCDGANLSIKNINNDNLSGTYIDYKNGYGIASQNEGGVEIAGEGTSVKIYGACLSGIYCSDKTDSETDNYLTVSKGATLTIDGGSTSTAEQHAGIKMESNGTISVTGGASVDIKSTIYGIAVGADCLVEVDGVGSEIDIHDLATHGEKQNEEQGVYAGANTIINVKNEGKLSVEGANYAIVFEVGNSGKDGVFVTNEGMLDITNSDLGIYVQGGTTSVEFTSGAVVNMDVNSVAIGSDNDSIFSKTKEETIYSYVVGHILMSDEGTKVNLKGDWVFSMNYKYLKIADSAVVDVTATSEAISLGSWKNAGGNLIVTGDAVLNIAMTEDAKYSGIATYGTSHYIEFSDGAKVTISGGADSKGITLSKPTTMYVSDATLIIENAKGIEANGAGSAGSLLYEDSLSHIEATTVFTSQDGNLDLIVMGGTLTYDFNHENNIWPYNAYGTKGYNKTIEISKFATDAFEVNEIDPVRTISYNKDEALVNFIVPSDSSHLSFAATYQNLADGISTYTYKSDADKEEDTLSIWVPGVEVYYNFDENTDLLDTDLTGEYVSELEQDSTVKFTRLYENVTEPYDMVIRGQSLRFSAFSVDLDSDIITLKYARTKDNAVVDHVLTDKDGVTALYKTQYKAGDGTVYNIQWYYGNTKFMATEEDAGKADDSTTDNGALNAFTSTSTVYREAEANAYGLLTTVETDVDWDVSKSKEATNLDENYVSTVTLSLPSAEYQPVTDVVFVLDRSSSSDPARNEIASMLNELLELVNNTDAVIRVGVVNFSYQVDSGIELTELRNETIADIEDVIWPTHQSGTNIQAGIDAGVAMLDADTEVDDDNKYLILLTDGISHAWTNDDGTIMTLWGEGEADGSVVFDGANSYYYFDTTKTPFSTIYAMEESNVALNSGKDVTVYNDNGIVRAAADVESDGSYLTLSEYGNYLSGTEKAVYYAAHAYAEAASKYKCISLYWDTDGYEVANQFMSWTATVGKAYYIGSAGAANNFEDAFTEIKNEIYYLLGAGSYVTDYIGYVENGYDFDLVKGSFVLTVGDVEYTSTGEFDASNGTYTYKFADGDYVVVYTPGTLKNDEHFTWYINVDVSVASSVSLSYDVVLTNPETAAGTYGTYDRYGTDGGMELYTNTSATLYPVDSEGNPGDPEDFNKPTVSYTVVEETTPETPAEETTETADPVATVATEIVSAVTGDNAPIGIAILIAAISEITLLILIVLQMRKKKVK